MVKISQYLSGKRIKLSKRLLGVREVFFNFCFFVDFTLVILPFFFVKGRGQQEGGGVVKGVQSDRREGGERGVPRVEEKGSGVYQEWQRYRARQHEDKYGPFFTRFSYTAASRSGEYGRKFLQLLFFCVYLRRVSNRKSKNDASLSSEWTRFPTFQRR